MFENVNWSPAFQNHLFHKNLQSRSSFTEMAKKYILQGFESGPNKMWGPGVLSGHGQILGTHLVMAVVPNAVEADTEPSTKTQYWYFTHFQYS